jgi:uracil-DNA glycosylase family 4
VDRRLAFDELARTARRCVACGRMKCSKRVIGHASGRLDAPVMFVGEAPGRLGADASSIPFHGDKAGDNFEGLLEQVGLSRYDCFITNAVLCNPRDDKGNNSTPSREELANCSIFLQRQIDLIQPSIVVTLGAQALQALRLIEPHDLSLAGGVRNKYAWYRRILIPLYHPGQRAMIHRSFFNQLVDYRFVAETYRRLGQERRQAEVRPNFGACGVSGPTTSPGVWRAVLFCGSQALLLA